MEPLISFITPTYNSQNTIQRIISSLESQKIKNFEQIIIDNLSTDKTVMNAKRYAKSYEIKILCESDHGIYDAMNKGIAIANGRYLWFLNSDDYLASSNITKIVESIIYDNSCPDMICGKTRVMNLKSEKTKRVISPKIKKSFYLPQLPHPSLLVNRNFIDDFRIKFDLKKTIAADYKMQLEIYKNGGCMIPVDSIFTHMSDGGLSNQGLSTRFKGWKESKEAYEEVFKKNGLLNTFFKIMSNYF